MTGTPERLGGDPRNNADDAYATFMAMPIHEWQGLCLSLLRGGALQPAEREGFDRALAERSKQRSPHVRTGASTLRLCPYCDLDPCSCNKGFPS